MDRSASAFDLYLADVSRLMLERYGLGWEDACGDVAPVERAWRDGEAAEAFVEWWAGKYALVALESAGLPTDVRSACDALALMPRSPAMRTLS